jgi:hypothetical protein
MALFLSANIHQGDELFDVHSRGKQCAFISLSALVIQPEISHCPHARLEHLTMSL